MWFRGFLKGNLFLGFNERKCGFEVFEMKCGFRVFLKGNVVLGFLKLNVVLGFFKWDVVLGFLKWDVFSGFWKGNVVLGFWEWNAVFWSFQHFLKFEMRSIFCFDLWKLSLNLKNKIRIFCDLKLGGFGVWNFDTF